MKHPNHDKPTRFKVGDPLRIKKEHINASWYSENLYYVKSIINGSESYLEKGCKRVAKYPLILIQDIYGNEQVVHDSKCYLVIEESRDYKLCIIGI